MIKDLLNDAQDRMEKVEKILISEFSSMRAGRATPALLDRIMVDYYGTPTPVNQTANISCPEPRMILVQPWDKNMLAAIEKAILKSDLGITPNSDGTVIRLVVPQLTEERRKELVKQCSKKAEESKVS
ncbi:MAG: ribosome recycling factor, partial [Bacillota bacterium]|nr:ribosome recycling factor [Bacillota bacterium]